jgi:hypothetical protein
VDWIHLASENGPVEGSCEDGNELSGLINVGEFLSSCTTGAFSRSQLHGVSYVLIILPSIYTQLEHRPSPEKIIFTPVLNKWIGEAM